MTETMTNAELLGAGVNLMLLGMLVVFSLLGVLVFVVGVMSRLAGKIAPAPVPVELPPEPARKPDEEMTSVISAAVHRYRRSRGK
jgi:oxaloacetate decarboxylase gamma subunit